MRSILLAGLCLLIGSCELYAQNKTLGVGVASPNPNAALHVESPTTNQGLILPRLTTAQRLASPFLSALSATDNGLIVYDTDLNTLFIWNGSTWQNSGQVAGGVKLSYPYKDSVATGTGTPDLFALKYNNDEPKRLLRIENHGEANGSSTVSVYNKGTGFAGYFQVANPESTSSTFMATTNSDAGGDLAPVAVYGESTGTGSLGGSFRILHANNNFPALFAETNGTGTSIYGTTATGFSAIMGEVPEGFSNGVSGVSHSPETGSYGVLGTNTGAGPAGVFNISNETSTSTALQVNTNGLGPAARIVNDNPASNAPAVHAETAGPGRVAFFRRTNTQSTQPAIFVDTQGGHGIWADHNGTSGYAAIIQNINESNPDAAMFVEAVGSGTSMWVQKSLPASTGNAILSEHAGSAGSAGSFVITNSANPSSAVFATTNGSGSAVNADNTGTADGFAGSFRNTNAGNTYPAIQASTEGTGSGVRVMQSTGVGPGMDVYMQNGGSSAPGLVVQQNGRGDAGAFTINNVQSSAPALNAITNGTGPAMKAEHQNNGMAIEMVNGGFKYSVATISSTGAIAQVAGVYKVTVSGTVSLPTSVPEGTFCKVFNGSAGNVTVDPVMVLGSQSDVSVSQGMLQNFIFLNGAWYENP